VVRTGHFEKILEMVLQLLCLVLEVTLDSYDMFLIGADNFLIITIIAGHDSDAPGALLLPLLVTHAPFLVPLTVNLGGGAQLPPLAAFTLPRTKAAPTASSSEACRVATSSSSLVVFD
jgi:hypothetical protein